MDEDRLCIGWALRNWLIGPEKAIKIRLVTGGRADGHDSSSKSDSEPSKPAEVKSGEFDRL